VVACQDGAHYPCEPTDAGVCQIGIATCNGGQVGACGALEASNSVFGCGPGCDSCDSALADHCEDGGTCACGTTGALCANGTTCCPAAGCVDVATDPSNCKSCGNDCTPRAPPHMDPLCGTLDCEFECSQGYGDCSAGTYGCETHIAEDPGHCGSCTNPCSTNHNAPTCSDGTCVLHCSPVPNGGGLEYADCDGNPGNGCEADLANDAGTCGSCNTVCSTNHATPTCSKGACAFSCASGYVSCNSLNDGCEQVENAAHCGSSCRPCSGPTKGPGHPECSSGACQIACDDGTSLCGTECVDLDTAPDHCGTCGNTCPGPTAGPGVAACSNGTCTLDCDSGYSPCNGKCVNLSTDEASCGTCGNACPIGDTCSSGLCCHTECPPCHQVCG
jgi:hypothetical protein